MHPMFHIHRFAAVVFVALALVFAAQPVAASNTAASVNGGGYGILTDPYENAFPTQFTISGTLATDGKASGHVNFVFRREMANFYGIVPGEEMFHVYGRVTSGSKAADGTITLMGTVTGADFNNGQGKIGVVKNDPFVLMVGGSLGPDTFTFQFCALPVWYITLTDGELRVRYEPGQAAPLSAAATPACRSS